MSSDDCKEIFKNFGKVPCGHIVKKAFRLTNESTEPRLFTVKPENPNLIYNPIFEIEPIKKWIKPKETCTFKISYLDFVPDVFHSNRYVVNDDEKTLAVLTVSAQSFGSEIKVCKNNLNFTSPGEKFLELTNFNSCPTRFQFQVKSNDWLKVSELNGTILGDKKFSFLFTFDPEYPGIYCKKIFCLFQFHKPLTFYVTGTYMPMVALPRHSSLSFPKVNGDVKNDFDIFVEDLIKRETLYRDNPCLTKRLKKLLQKCAKDKESSESVANTETKSKTETTTSSESENPSELIILTNYYVNMGKEKALEKATTLMNLSKSVKYIFEWDYDPRNHFLIDPLRGIISPNEKIQMTVTFRPDAPDQLYHAQLDLRIFPNNRDEGITYPVTLSLYLIGDSFSIESCGWMAQYDIKPRPILLPPCMPGEIVYTTAIIEKRGHLPLTFQFIPPENSHYIIKPPMGYITDSFQLLVIRFDATSKEGNYSENWKVIFNNIDRVATTLTLTTLVDVPKIIFGKNNSYNFDTTYPGDETRAEIPLKNPTYFSLSYEFVIPEDIPWLEFPNPKGIIESLAEITIEAVFKPPEAGEYLDYVTCILSPIKNLEYYSNIDLEISGSSQYGFLVAMPGAYDFGEVCLGTTQSLKVNLFNFTTTTIQYYLRAISKGFEITDPFEDVQIIPNKGSVHGKSQDEIEIFLTPHSKEIVEYSIISGSREIRTLMDISFEGVIPSFQVEDLNVIGGGPLFSPFWIWRMMEINRFNEILSNLKPEETQTLEMRFPDAEMKSMEIKIILLLKALKYREVSWCIKRKTQCGCLMTEKQTGASKRNRYYDCPHRRTMNILPQKGTLNPGDSATLEITIKHELIGFTRQEWVVELSDNRKIIIETDILALSTEEASAVSMYMKPELNLKPTFIGELEPPAQLFWLYNNTRRPSSYVLDKSALREAVPFSCGQLECLNPCGTIPPFSSLPLIFSFKPTELQLYSAEILLCTRIDDPTRFCITGEGIPYREPVKDLLAEKSHPKNLLLIVPEIDLIPSIRLINIKPFSTFSETQSIFFVCNTSKHKAWAFQWHVIKLGKILKARVEPSMGLLKPGESTLMKIIIESFSQPADILFSIPCDIADETNLKQHESVYEYESLSNRFEDQFATINGENSQSSTMHVSKKPTLHHFFITVNTSIISFRYIDQRLSIQQQLKLKINNGIQYGEYEKPILEKEEAKVIFETMEKILWLTVNSKSFEYRFEKFRQLEQPTYRQILPRSRKENEEISKRLKMTPSLNLTQRLLENSLLQIISNQINEK